MSAQPDRVRAAKCSRAAAEAMDRVAAGDIARGRCSTPFRPAHTDVTVMTTHPVHGVRGPDDLLIGVVHRASCDRGRTTGATWATDHYAMVELL
jgi:hypothetical protein